MSRNIFRRYEAFLEAGGQHFLRLCCEIRQGNCREKEPTLKFLIDAGFICEKKRATDATVKEITTRP
jgi:hypothetical protein